METLLHKDKECLANQPVSAIVSIMIIPSEDDVKAGHTNGNVTSPFVTETYRCVAAYETKDTKNKAFKVDKDEKVDVLIKDKAGQWKKSGYHQLVGRWLVSPD